MDNSNVNIDLIRDHVDTIILSTLANGDRYGLDILSEIKENSKGLYELKQPTLYSCLKRLKKLGYITSYKGDTSNGAQRVYYSLLDDGRNFLEKDQYQWEYSRTIINGLLSSKDFNPDENPPFNASELRPRTKRQPRSELSAAEAADVNEPQIIVDQSSNDLDDSAIEVAQDSPVVLQGTDEDDNLSSNISNSNTVQQNLEHAHQTFKIANKDLKTVIVNKSSILYEQNVDYKKVLDDVFGTSPTPISQNNYAQSAPTYSYSNYNPTYAPQEDQDYASQYSIEAVSKKFESQGFTLKQYFKKNTTEFYVNKYLYINKILMFTALYSYILFALALIIMHLCTFKVFNTNINALLIPLGVTILYPIYTMLNYLVNPTKRIIADFSLKKTMSIASIFLINAFLIVIIIGFVGFGANFGNPASLVQPVIFPLLLILLVPCFIMIYSWLYSSTHYHVN